MVVAGVPHGDSAVAAAADELFTSGADLHAFFDNAALEGKAGGAEEEEEEELEWLSNKDAFPAVETMEPARARPRMTGVRRRQRVVASNAAARQCRHCGTERTPLWRHGPEGRRTLCNACGLRYRSGRLVPEYRPLNSPTFCPQLHSNQHSRIVEIGRRQGKSAKASDGEEKGGEEPEPERLSDKEVLPPGLTVACSQARARTKGLRRPRRAVAWSPSPPPPPSPPLRAPATGGSMPKIQLWRTSTTQLLAASAAAPVVGGAPGVEMGLGLITRPPVDVPLTPAPAVVHRRCGTEVTPQAPAAPGHPVCWNCGAVQAPLAPAAKMVTGQQEEGRSSGMEETPRSPPAKPPAAAGQMRCAPSGTKKTPELAAAASGQLRCGRGGTKKMPEPPAAKPATAGRRQCRHCGAEETPHWRLGPEGPHTLCNACGMQYRAGRLSPEYRPLKSPTLSPELHSNIRRRVGEMYAAARR